VNSLFKPHFVLNLFGAHLHFQIKLFNSIFDGSNWRQAEGRRLLLGGAVEVNTLAQAALRPFTQWLWVEQANLTIKRRTLNH